MWLNNPLVPENLSPHLPNSTRLLRPHRPWIIFKFSIFKFFVFTSIFCLFCCVGSKTGLPAFRFSVLSSSDSESLEIFILVKISLSNLYLHFDWSIQRNQIKILSIKISEFWLNIRISELVLF